MNFGLSNSGKMRSLWTRASFIFRLFIVISWGIILLPAYHLLTYTSIQATVWGRYSLAYAALLVFYFGAVLIWPFLLALPDSYIVALAQYLGRVRSQRSVHARFSLAAVALALFAGVISPIWGWGQDYSLRLALVLFGGWVAVQPIMWDWAIKGWQLNYFLALFGRLYEWVFQDIFIWLRPFIVVVVILLSALLAYKAPQRLLMVVPVLIPAIIGFIILYHRPTLGLLALIASIVIPINGPSGSNATMALVAFLTGLWLFDMILRYRTLRLVSSISILPLMALVLVAVLAFGVGQLPWYTLGQPAPLGAQLGGLSVFILSAVAFLLVAHVVRDIHWLEWMVWLYLVVGALFIAGWFLPPLKRLTDPFYSYSGVTGSLFWNWLVALAFSQAVFNRKLNLIWRGALGVLVLATLKVGLVEMRDWNSGWVPALVSIVGILWAAKPSLGLAATFMGMLGGLTKLQKLTSFVMVGDNEYSLSTRIDAWLIVLKMAKVNPILGLGLANYNSYAPLFPIRGYAVRFNSHSQYIDLIAQTGYLGLACFFWFFAAVGWMGWKLRKRVPPGGFAQAYVYGALGGLVGTLASAALGDWVLPFFYNIGLTGFRASVLTWIFLGGLVAIEQMTRHSESLSRSKITSRGGSHTRPSLRSSAAWEPALPQSLIY